MNENNQNTNNWLKASLLYRTKEYSIEGIAVDDNDNVYFTLGKHGLWKTNVRENNKNTVQLLSQEGSNMKGMVWDGDNIIYICDDGKKMILQYSIDTGKLDPFAGTGEQGFKDGNLKEATFYALSAITKDHHGDLYITELNRIRKVHLKKGNVKTIAGPRGSNCDTECVNGRVKKAVFFYPNSIAVDDDGTVYVAEHMKNSLRKIKNGVVSGLGPPRKHGIFYAITMDHDGTILVMDGLPSQHILRRIDADSNNMAKIMNVPCSQHMLVDSQGSLYVAGASKQNESEIWQCINKSSIKSSLSKLTTWKHIRLFLVGDSGAGKTSLVRWLKGENFVSEHISTDSVDVTTTDATSWKSASLDIKDYITTIVRKNASTQINTELFATSNCNNKIILQPTTKKVVIPRAKISGTLETDVVERMNKVKEISQAFHVWDFGGQEEYYNTHHLFLTKSAIYLLVVDISKLHQEARIIFWINSIRYYAKDAPIVIIGTHKDQQKDFSKIMNDLFNQFKPHIYNMSKEYCVAISLKDDYDSTDFKTVLIQIAQKKVLENTQCKLAWMLFFDKLMDGKNWIHHGSATNNQNNHCDAIATVNLETATILGLDCAMRRSEVKKALQFYHEHGFVLYYDVPGLQDIIFVQPQQLTLVLRTVITDSKLTIPNGSYENVFSTSPEEGFLKTTGIVSLTTLKKVWKNYSGLERQLQLLLEQFELALPDPNSPEEEPGLIIPCLVETDSTLQISPSFKTCICNLDGVPPLGFQSRLIVHMLKMVKKPFCVFKGGCDFPFHGMLIKLLISSGTVNIHFSSNNAIDVSAVQQLLRGIDEVASKYQVKLKAIRARCFHEQCKANSNEAPNVVIRFPITSISSITDFYCNNCQVQNSVVLPPKLAPEPETVSLEITDLTDQHTFRLSKLLDVPGSTGFPEAITFAKRLSLDEKTIHSISQHQSPTRALLNYLGVYGTPEQQQLSYLIKVLLTDPPMHGPAKILKQGNQL